MRINFNTTDQCRNTPWRCGTHFSLSKNVEDKAKIKPQGGTPQCLEQGLVKGVKSNCMLMVILIFFLIKKHNLPRSICHETRGTGTKEKAKKVLLSNYEIHGRGVDFGPAVLRWSYLKALFFPLLMLACNVKKKKEEKMRN